MCNGKNVMVKDNSTGLKDMDDKEIHINDIMLTDEAGWHGRVVKDDFAGGYLLIDEEGGFCDAGDWNKYKIVYRLGQGRADKIKIFTNSEVMGICLGWLVVGLAIGLCF